MCERDFIYVLCVTASEEEVHEGVHAVSEDKNTKKPKLKKLFKNCNTDLDARSRIGRSAGKHTHNDL